MTASISLGGVRLRGTVLLGAAAGFFFVFRACLTFLFFQQSPVLGSAVTVAADLALLYGALLATTGEGAVPRRPVLSMPAVRWTLLLLALALVSIAWTGAQSRATAFAYWAALAADVAAVLLLLCGADAECVLEALLQGTVLGAAALAAVAWCSPVTADLRLGSDAFLHPNTLGLEIGTATLVAQYLAPSGRVWKWLAIGLAITLLRTFSKTAILAFLIAECWYLVRSREISRRVKWQMTFAAALVVAVFWGLLRAYLDIYSSTGSGNQAETLTGRTLLWAIVVSMGVERPWFGHGFYSFKALVPALGDFAPVHAHNELLQQFFEFGMVGVVVAAAVYWSFYRQAVHAPAGALRSLALTLLAFALLHGLTDTVPFGLSCPLWLLVALSLALGGRGRIAEVRPS